MGPIPPRLPTRRPTLGYRLACTTHEGTVNENTERTSVPRIDVSQGRFAISSRGTFAAGLFQIDLMRAGRT